MKRTRFLREDLAKFVKDPRTIKTLEELMQNVQSVSPTALTLNLDNSITLTLNDGSEYTTDPIPTSSGGGADMFIVLADGATYTIPDNVQRLYNVPLTLLGTATIVTTGTGTLAYAD